SKSIVVWLTEPVVGGGGIVEQLAEEALASPRRLLRLAEAAVRDTDYELADRAQRGLIRLANTEPEVADELAAFRDAASPDRKRSILQRILAHLAEAGLPAGRTVAAAVTARLLRPGSTPASDAVLLDLVNQIDRLETLLGFEPDARAL